MHWIAELLGGRRIGIVRAEVGVIGFFAVGASLAVVLHGFRVIDDHAVIAVTISYIQFIGGGIDNQFRGSLQVFGVIDDLAFTRVADLHEEFAALGQFQDHVVMIALGIGAAAVAADPNGAFVIDSDAVVRIGPIVTRSRAAPIHDEIALFGELKNRLRRNADL